jgi:hypothetical protein
VNGKIRLRPAAPLTQGANATAKPNGHVSCHEYSIAVFFWLHIAYRIQMLYALASRLLASPNSGSNRADLDDYDRDDGLV